MISLLYRAQPFDPNGLLVFEFFYLPAFAVGIPLISLWYGKTTKTYKSSFLVGFMGYFIYFSYVVASTWLEAGIVFPLTGWVQGLIVSFSLGLMGAGSALKAVGRPVSNVILLTSAILWLVPSVEISLRWIGLLQVLIHF